MSSGLKREYLEKKVFKNVSPGLRKKKVIFEKHQKLLYIDKALWFNQLTYNTQLGISERTMFILWFGTPQFKICSAIGSSGS